MTIQTPHTTKKRAYTKRPRDVSHAQKLLCRKHIKRAKVFADRVTDDLEQMLDEYEKFLKDGPTLLDV